MKSITGMHKGYWFRRARICDVLATDQRALAFHVWIGGEKSGEYVGHFPTLKAVETFIDNNGSKAYG